MFFSIRYKPSSVLGIHRASIIYLLRRSLAVSSNLPPDIGRATLNCRYTWSCNPRGVLPRSIATLAVGSYPAFSPLPPEGGGYFLLHCYTLTNIKPLTCAVLCVARTFLPHPKVAAIERICGCKDSQKISYPTSQEEKMCVARILIGTGRYSSTPRRLAWRCMSHNLNPSDTRAMPYDTNAMATKSITTCTPSVAGIHSTAIEMIMTMAE